jgi:hypothetical protein
MTPKTAHLHDIVTDTLFNGWGFDWEYWDALQKIIDAPDFEECDEMVKQAAYAAAHNGDLDQPRHIQGPF